MANAKSEATRRARIAEAHARRQIERFDRLARQLGYRSIKVLLASSRRLSHVDLGAKLGVSAKSAANIRRRLGYESVQPQRNKGQRHDYNGLAHAHGYPSLEALLDGNRHLSTPKLAQFLGIGYATAWRLRQARPPRYRRIDRLAR